MNLRPVGAETDKKKRRLFTHHFGMVCIQWVCILEQGLELVILGEGDDLQDCAKLGEDLWRK